MYQIKRLLGQHQPAYIHSKPFQRPRMHSFSILSPKVQREHRETRPKERDGKVLEKIRCPYNSLPRFPLCAPKVEDVRPCPGWVLSHGLEDIKC